MNTFVTTLLLLLAGPVFASEQCKINDIAGFYSYVKEKGPILQEVQMRKLQIASKVDVAEQRPNPQIDFEYRSSDQLGVDVNNYAFSAKHIIEFGSKRDKRIEKAQSYKSLKDNEVDLNFYQENLKAILSFQRVAQLTMVIKAVREAIHTFDKIVDKLSIRKSLNPEETVSLSTLRLASSDYKAKLNDLENEKTLLEGRLSFLANCENLRPTYKTFKFKSLDEAHSKPSSLGLIELEDLKVNLVQNELEVQKSLGYSNIAIGPSLEFQSQGNDDFLSAGIAVTFSLPIFNTNDGGKLEALRAVHTQKVSSHNNKQMLKIQREKLAQKYERSLRTLKLMPALDALERKHEKVEKLFSRGVVSIQMTIESHRQQVDFLKSRFETENDVLDTLGKISMIDGSLKAFEVLF